MTWELRLYDKKEHSKERDQPEQRPSVGKGIGVLEKQLARVAQVESEMKTQSSQAGSCKACQEPSEHSWWSWQQENDKVKLFFRKNSYKSRMLMRKMKMFADPHERN